MAKYIVMGVLLVCIVGAGVVYLVRPAAQTAPNEVMVKEMGKPAQAQPCSAARCD